MESLRCQDISEDYDELSFGTDMAWSVPEHSRSKVDWAGDVLVHPSSASIDELAHALDIINNWRSSHSFPLNTLKMGLRDKAKRVDAKSIIAQRIKRLSSIRLKLDRFNWLKLSHMQDIGGCRAVVRSVVQVRELMTLYKGSWMKHNLDHIDDYINSPKKSGYRGVHLIYKYQSDRNKTYNGLRIEMQLRTQIQHAWATAVETVGTFTQQALKSSQGEEEWLRFFTLMGNAFAMREKTALVPNTPTNRKKLIIELNQYAAKLDVQNKLASYGAALRAIETDAKDAQYYLMELDPIKKEVTITGYQSNELQKASDQYLSVEQSLSKTPGSDAVLVSVESVEALRRAYPNYFLDTHAFISAVNQFISPQSS